MHRALPIEMRSLGDDYVKAGVCRLLNKCFNRAYLSTSGVEFKRHQKIDNPVHIIGFLSQWKLYLDQLESQSSNGTEQFRGHKMDPIVFEKVR